jgi:hypothetical protein
MFEIPIFGAIGTTEIVVTCIAGVFGYVIGSGLKSSMKYVVAFFAVIVVLVALGLVGTPVLAKLAEMFAALGPIIPTFEGGLGVVSAMSLPLTAFGATAAWGLLKG